MSLITKIQRAMFVAGIVGALGGSIGGYYHSKKFVETYGLIQRREHDESTKKCFYLITFSWPALVYGGRSFDRRNANKKPPEN